MARPSARSQPRRAERRRARDCGAASYSESSAPMLRLCTSRGRSGLGAQVLFVRSARTADRRCRARSWANPALAWRRRCPPTIASPSSTGALRSAVGSGSPLDRGRQRPSGLPLPSVSRSVRPGRESRVSGREIRVELVAWRLLASRDVRGGAGDAARRRRESSSSSVRVSLVSGYQSAAPSWNSGRTVRCFWRVPSARIV